MRGRHQPDNTAPCNQRNPCQNVGFTLIELLVVLAILGILTNLTLSFLNKLEHRKQLRLQAKSDMALIANALERYKLYYGHYPRIDNDPDALRHALIEKRPLMGKSQENASVAPIALQNVSALHLNSRLLDPWGTPYYYAYRRDRTRFRLLSAGPNQQFDTIAVTDEKPESILAKDDILFQGQE